MLISRSLLKGIGRGLAAHGTLVEAHRIQRDPRFNPSVENAWKDVGKHLRDAYDKEGEHVGKKTTGNTGSSRRPRHPA